MILFVTVDLSGQAKELVDEACFATDTRPPRLDVSILDCLDHLQCCLGIDQRSEALPVSEYSRFSAAWSLSTRFFRYLRST
jgi:hypothetical protein